MTERDEEEEEEEEEPERDGEKVHANILLNAERLGTSCCIKCLITMMKDRGINETEIDRKRERDRERKREK